ncbi:MAG: DUF3224 domain-containing protein [Polymorphobacter sp.]|uniref:DUF3224 domain-containing protein n=1 Tax=Polymorphobacter sp. TaxID=1909290 RepID=UPI003A868F13
MRTGFVLAALAAIMGGEAMAAEQVARGSFTVSMTPEDGQETDGLSRARLKVEKQFEGGLVAASEGTMLSATTPEQGSAAYVLIERVAGTLDGRAGSFALAHLGLMDKGAPQLSVTIVPGSGTGALAGLRGEMTLDVGGGRHDYVLRYSLEGH